MQSDVVAMSEPRFPVIRFTLKKIKKIENILFLFSAVFAQSYLRQQDLD